MKCTMLTFNLHNRISLRVLHNVCLINGQASEDILIPRTYLAISNFRTAKLNYCRVSSKQVDEYLRQLLQMAQIIHKLWVCAS